MSKTVEEHVMDQLTKDAFKNLDLGKLRAKYIPALQKKMETDMLKWIKDTNIVEDLGDWMDWDAIMNTLAKEIQIQIAPKSVKKPKSKTRRKK